MITNNKNILIDQNKNLNDGLIALQANATQICLVVNKNLELVGTITDGDLRRALLKKIDFKTPLKKIMNKKPITLPAGSGKSKIIKTLKKYKLSSLPIVSKNNKIENLIKLSDFVKTKKIPNTVVIMSGGLGTRLRPYTYTKPKCLLKIKNKPILQHIIERASYQGFNNFIISINYLGDKITKFVKKIKDLNIKFIKEKKRLGTAGSLSLLNKKKLKNGIIVINGDIITNLELDKILQFHNDEKTDATMAVKIISKKSSFGIIKNIKGNIVNLEEKPVNYSMVNAGIYVLNKRVIKFMKYNECMEMTDLFKFLIKRKKNIKAYPIHEKWSDIGTKRQFYKYK